MLLSMNSLEAANAGAQQNNTESFAVALCHLAELHAEQVGRGHAPSCLFSSAPGGGTGLGGGEGAVGRVRASQSLLDVGPLLASAKGVRGEPSPCVGRKECDVSGGGAAGLCRTAGV